MWAAHVGRIPEGLQINHKNGVKADNQLENLELVTRSENMLHASRLGLLKPVYRPPKTDEAKQRSLEGLRKGRLAQRGQAKPSMRGHNHPSAKLTTADVVSIRDLARQGMAHRVIGARYSVSHNYVSEIVRRKLWKHVP